MADNIQIKTGQITDDAVTADKVNLAAGAYDFSSGGVLSVTTQAASTNSVLAASTAYVDAAVGAGYSAGVGIAIAGGVITAKAAINAGITYAGSAAGDGAQVVLDATKSLSVDSNGIAVEVLTAGGIAHSGSAGLSLRLGGMMQIASGVLELKDDKVTLAKMKWSPKYEEFTAQTGTTITVAGSIPVGYELTTVVYKNGLRLSYDADPSTNNEYKALGTTITFGAVCDTADLIQIQYVKE